jgi:hypothetical protein
LPASQKNFDLFEYVDNQGNSWNKRGEEDAVRNAVDGSATFGAFPNWGKESPRHRVRKAIYRDPTTFRTKTIIVYTQAAQAAITLGTDTLSFPVEGLATAVVYTAYAFIDEKLGSVGAARNLVDHA